MINKLFTLFIVLIILHTARGQGNYIAVPVGVYGSTYNAATTIANGGNILVGNNGVWGFGGNITSADKGNYNAPNATGRTETVTFSGTGNYSGAATTAGASTGNFIDGYAAVIAPTTDFTLPLGSTGSAPDANAYTPLTIPATPATVTAAYFDGLAGTDNQPPGTAESNGFYNGNNAQVLSPYFDVNNTGSVSGIYTIGYPSSFPSNHGSVLSGPDPVGGLTTTQYQTTALNWIGSFSDLYSASGGTGTTASAITVPSGQSSLLFASSENTLPINLSAFTAVAGAGDVLLNWNTAQEINNQGFEVERSTNNQAFIPLGFINSKAANEGNSAVPLQYTYVDNAPVAGTNYYRLKQVDINGNFSYSKTVSAIVTASAISVFPNPASTYVKVSGAASDAQYKIINEAGQVIPVSVAGNRINIVNLGIGTYFLQITSNGITKTVKIIKQ